jgi:ferrochelatase
MPRVAIVLFNLGGPDRPEAVEPFLFNLFSDPAIIRAPNPVRWLVAKLVSRRRAPEAREIYEKLGGKSPLLDNTIAQAEALATLNADWRVFTAMRYWHPMAEETAREVAEFAPDAIVLLPLYPQFSTTTTASSARAWFAVARRAGLACPTRLVCCYPQQDGFIAALAELTRGAITIASHAGPVRVLFSAHGLPQRVVDGGDPYQAQVEATAAAVAEKTGIAGLDRIVCYQSRVGPLEWIRPYTDDEIRRAGRDGRAVVLAPIAFVSEHSETLVELDITYRELAHASGVKYYERVPTVSTHPGFIAGLRDVVQEALAAPAGICPHGGTRWCAAKHTGCPLASAAGS